MCLFCGQIISACEEKANKLFFTRTCCLILSENSHLLALSKWHMTNHYPRLLGVVLLQCLSRQEAMLAL